MIKSDSAIGAFLSNAAGHFEPAANACSANWNDAPERSGTPLPSTASSHHSQEFAEPRARFGQPRSLRLLRSGHLGQLYELALRERGFEVTADDAEQASRRGLSKAAINIWGAQF